jgi:hypothetical protein
MRKKEVIKTIDDSYLKDPSINDFMYDNDDNISNI